MRLSVSDGQFNSDVPLVDLMRAGMKWGDQKCADSRTAHHFFMQSLTFDTAALLSRFLWNLQLLSLLLILAELVVIGGGCN